MLRNHPFLASKVHHWYSISSGIPGTGQQHSQFWHPRYSRTAAFSVLASQVQEDIGILSSGIAGTGGQRHSSSSGIPGTAGQRHSQFWHPRYRTAAFSVLASQVQEDSGILNSDIPGTGHSQFWNPMYRTAAFSVLASQVQEDRRHSQFWHPRYRTAAFTHFLRPRYSCGIIHFWRPFLTWTLSSQISDSSNHRA
jgi:hypothetical protein